MEAITRILNITPVTHDVIRFRLERPEGYDFNPGQATEVSINSPDWKEEKRPFTFTSLREDPYLEFTIKIYTDHSGVTSELARLHPGDELIIRDVWGAIEYKGPGYFIAGGAGITPFIAILRQLNKETRLEGNKLFFSNKTGSDIILKEEFLDMLGENVEFAITDEPGSPYHNGFINEEFLRKKVPDFSRNFYLCGPPKMVEALTSILKKLGASPDSVIFEK
jgi:ferredoxin-NADP reductase